MFARLLALFVVVPVAELALLVWAGGRIGFWPTVGTVLVTALVGSWLARREGMAAWGRVQSSLAQGSVPGTALIDGLIILVAGALLLTPGFLTDLAGLAGLVPASRSLIRKTLAARFAKAAQSGRIRVATGGFGPMGAGAPFGTPFGAGFGTPPVEDAEVIEDSPRPLRDSTL